MLRLVVRDQPYPVVAVYRDDAHGCTAFEVLGGPKQYARQWDGTDSPDWGWTVSDAARLVWSAQQ